MKRPLVVIVAYRADDHLAACLGELDPDEAVTVIDNDASSATRAVCERFGVSYVAAERNLGFAGGVNAALAAGWDGERDVLLLNPDARMTSPVLTTLQEKLHAAPHRAAAAPALVGLDGSAQRATWPIPSPKQIWADAFALSPIRERCPFFLVGAALLLNGAALREVGTLDERYFLYSEEADWQLRARRAGWELVLAADVSVPHEGSASSSDPLRRLRIFHASGEIFGRKWYGPAGWQFMRLGGLVAGMRRSVTGKAEDRHNGRLTVSIFATGPLTAARRAGLLP